MTPGKPPAPAAAPMAEARLSIAGRAILVLWLLLWAQSILRLVRHDPGLPSRLLTLARADDEGRRSIAYGEELARFLRFCVQRLPDRATYGLDGVDRGSLDWARAVYFLYPSRLAVHPRFLLVFKDRSFATDGAVRFATLDDDSFILELPHGPAPDGREAGGR